MVDSVFNIIQRLNDYAGFLSLCAVLAAIVIPIAIFKRQKKNERNALQDEWEALNDSFRFPMNFQERETHIKKTFLQKRLSRK